MLYEVITITVTTANQVEAIEAFVIDNVTKEGQAGKTVSIQAITNGYGEVSYTSTTTNAAGKAVFSYQAPSDLSTVDGTVITSYSIHYTKLYE